MTTRFVVPSTWPSPPAGWTPPQGWQPDPAWGPAPAGWSFWQDEAPAAPALPAYTPEVSALPTRTPPRSWGRRLGWLAVLVGGLVSYLVVNQVLLDTRNLLFFPTLLLVGAVTVPAGVLLLAYAVGQGLDGHGGLIIGTAVLAGVVGVALAGWLESSLTGPPQQVYLGVAVVEELAKLVVPVAIFLVARRRTAGAGLALGIAAGAGFAVLETMGYAFYALVSRGGGLSAMQETLQIRALLAPASHLAWTGMTAWALWRVGATPRRRFAVPTLLVTFAAAVGLHYLWDQTEDLTAHIWLAVVSVGVLVTLMVLSARRDAARAHAGGPAAGPAAAAPGWFSPVALVPVQPAPVVSPALGEPARSATAAAQPALQQSPVSAGERHAA
ncbi:MAG TPA: PrsW family glutamic-type intramembrane protease [Propionibacteriaceae bacterium]|nr:PrsW family glutamic-type intramembrane protease [Propionibacteriaceae bacterium]